MTLLDWLTPHFSKKELQVVTQVWSYAVQNNSYIHLLDLIIWNICIKTILHGKTSNLITIFLFLTTISYYNHFLGLIWFWWLGSASKGLFSSVSLGFHSKKMINFLIHEFFFREHTECPVTGCGCHCMNLDSVAMAMPNNDITSSS